MECYNQNVKKRALESGPIENRIVEGLVKLSTAMRSAAWRSAGAAGLSPTQQHIIGMLQEAPEGVRPSQLARALQVSAATVSEAVAALFRKGYVASLDAIGDRRGTMLRLTATGRSVADDLSGHLRFLTDAVATLGSQERIAMLRGIVGTIQALQMHGEIVTAQMCVVCRHFRPNAHPGTLRPHHCAYVDAAFADSDLRVNCPEYSPLPERLP